jgi:hypothetical protein
MPPDMPLGRAITRLKTKLCATKTAITHATKPTPMRQ